MSISLKVVSIAIACLASTSRRATARRNGVMRTTSSWRPGPAAFGDVAGGGVATTAETAFGAGAAGTSFGAGAASGGVVAAGVGAGAGGVGVGAGSSVL